MFSKLLIQSSALSNLLLIPCSVVFIPCSVVFICYFYSLYLTSLVLFYCSYVLFYACYLFVAVLSEFIHSFPKLFEHFYNHCFELCIWWIACFHFIWVWGGEGFFSVLSLGVFLCLPIFTASLYFFLCIKNIWYVSQSWYNSLMQ